ncbi:MAG TPA: DUF3861 domain-containing protein [Granulicella sp.]
MSHRYRVTVEAVAEEGRSLHFEAENHDDLLVIVERMRSKVPFDGDSVAALGIGLKLLAEVALKHRENPMFTKLRPALREFIQDLKQLPGGELA